MPVFVPVLLGPPTAGITMTALVTGRAGLLDLRGRLLAWRRAGRWYLAALLPAPLMLLTVLLSMSAVVGPAYRPDPGALATGLLLGLAAGLVEETGWTGFSTPALRRRYGLWSTGAILGAAWGAWHLLPTLLVFSGTMTREWATTVLLQWVVTLTAYRMLIVWLYERTDSVLIAGLMHASYSASVFVLEPLATGSQELAWNLVFAGMIWAAVGGLMALPLRSRHPSSCGT